MVFIVGDDIDHTGYGVRAINGSCTVAQNFNPARRANRKRVGVGCLYRNKVFGLCAWGQDHATSVDQDQSITGTNAAQVDRRVIAAGIIEVAGCPGLLKLNIARLRDGPEKIVTGNTSRGGDTVFAQYRDWQGFSNFRTFNAAADNDDGFFRFGVSFGLIGRGRSLREQRRGDENGTADQQTGTH